MMARAADPAESSEYDPATIDRWLKEWDLLLSLAETPASSRHLLDSHCRHSNRPCGSTAPVGIRDARGRGSDPHRWSDVVADIERAHARLRPHSLAWTIIDYRMRRAGLKRWRDPATHARMQEPSQQLDAIALSMGQRAATIRRAYQDALKEMARSLGWSEH